MASEEFYGAYQAQAASLGFPASVCFVDHPIQDRTDDEMRALADKFAAEVLKLVLAGS